MDLFTQWHALAVLKSAEGVEMSNYVPCLVRWAGDGVEITKPYPLSLSVTRNELSCVIHFMDGYFVSHIILPVAGYPTIGGTVVVK